MMSLLVRAALLFALQDPTGRPVVGADVRPQSVAVGEPFTVRVRVRAAAGAVIRFPAVPDSAGSVEAVDPRAIEDGSTSTVFDQTATYRFIAWEPGRRDVPLGAVSCRLGRSGGVRVCRKNTTSSACPTLQTARHRETETVGEREKYREKERERRTERKREREKEREKERERERKRER